MNKITRSSSIKDISAKTANISSKDKNELDILVIGGGITGAGIALDAASRGLKTALVEAQDFSSGTSSRSSKMLHGGLRYLMMLDFHLVREALVERDLLFSKLAPYLAKPLPFLFPLDKRGWKKPPARNGKKFMQYFVDCITSIGNFIWPRGIMTMGIGMYDFMAKTGGNKKALPIQKHYSKDGLKKVFPDINNSQMSGAIRYYDGMIDDSRLVLDVIKTAKSKYNAKVISRAQVIEIIKTNKGEAKGAIVKDLETGKNFIVKAKKIISATGVWTEKMQSLVSKEGGLQVLASKGIHLIIPRNKINGQFGIATMTEKSILFVIPWKNYWIVGTTDTPWDEEFKHPVPTNEDIEYVLEHLNGILTKKITKKDVIGYHAGLRPLLQPKLKAGTSSAKVSREHTVATIAPNFVSISGGKLTTYRVMAKDAVDTAIGDLRHTYPSNTNNIPLIGADDYDNIINNAKKIAIENDVKIDTVNHLIDRYGSKITEIFELIKKDNELKKEINGGQPYIGAEIVYACGNEMAMHLEDCLISRTRLFYEVNDFGIKASIEIANIMAKELKWSPAKKTQEISSYKNRIISYKNAMKQHNDKDAVAKRLKVNDIVKTVNNF